MKIGHKPVLASLCLALLVWAVGFYAIEVSWRALQVSIEESSAELAAEIMEQRLHRFNVPREYRTTAVHSLELEMSARLPVLTTDALLVGGWPTSSDVGEGLEKSMIPPGPEDLGHPSI